MIDSFKYPSNRASTRKHENGSATSVTTGRSHPFQLRAGRPRTAQNEGAQAEGRGRPGRRERPKFVVFPSKTSTLSPASTCARMSSESDSHCNLTRRSRLSLRCANVPEAFRYSSEEKAVAHECSKGSQSTFTHIINRSVRSGESQYDSTYPQESTCW